MDWINFSDPVFLAILAIAAILVGAQLSQRKATEDKQLKAQAAEADYQAATARKRTAFAERSELPPAVAEDLAHRGGIEDIRIRGARQEGMDSNELMSDELRRIREAKIEDAKVQERLNARAKKRGGKGGVPEALRDDVRGPHRKAGPPGGQEEGGS